VKIANKISLSFLAAAIIITVVAEFGLLKVSEESLKAQIIAHLETTARSREDHVETYLKLIKVATAQLSKSVVLETFLEARKDDPGWARAYEQAMTRLRRTKEVNPAIYEFLLMDAAGKVVASSIPASIGQDRSADTLFTEGLKETHIKGAYYSDIYKIPLIAVSAPIINSSTGQAIGVLASRNTLKDLDQITTDRTGLGKSGEIYIVNKDGYMITPSRRVKDTFLKQKVDTESFRMCMRRKAESETSLKTIICPDYMGSMMLGTSAYITGVRWALIAEIDISEAFAPLQKLRGIFIFALILVLATAWFMGRAIAARITSPLHKLHEGIEIIAEGNLAYRVGTPAKDEIGQLSRAFDTMTSELKKKIVSIYDLNKEVAERKKAESDLREANKNLKTAQQAIVTAEKMSSLGRFSYGVAHEIKNPLGIILGGMEYLQAKFRDADEESKETIGMVSDSVLRVDAIINALTALSRPTGGVMKTVNVNTLISDMVGLTRSKLALRQIAFNPGPAGEEISIEADADQIQYALLAILTNAIDATPIDGTIRITARKEPPDCVIDIADNGDGISEDALPKVFEPFFTTRRDRKHIGLGLTVAKTFIDVNKGDISITSKKGEGTAVKISFPMAA
jgi:signal transduction histidine kinase